MRSILTVDDLSDNDVYTILARARELRASPHLDRCSQSRHRRLLSLIFFEPSLRTRVGFIAAATRLGWGAVEIFERRQSQVSMAESWFDTLRTVAGYSDVIVARPGQPFGHDELVVTVACPVINGGDVGLGAQHPSQALIDLFAIQQLVGPIAGVHLAIVGDPRMRAVRSLLAFLARMPPAALTLVADAEHLDEVCIPSMLRSIASMRSWNDLNEVDVVYIAGIPHGVLPLDRRNVLLATAARVEALPAHCVLLSPMPVIDEMDGYVRWAPRNRMFEQSDLGLYVRMAILEHVVQGNS